MVVRLQIDRTEPFADGMAFGATGPYVRLMGTAYGELDPEHPLHAGIVNLARAPRNAHGRVEYEMDVYIMRPEDVTRGSRTLLYEVNNRGRKMLLPIFHEAAQTSPGAINDPTTVADAGNGLTFRRGYTLAWSGWDPDAPNVNQNMRLRAPVATENGQPIIQTIRDEFIFGTRVPTTRQTAPLSYAAATLDPSQARLTVRSCESDERTEIPPDQWTYADARSIKLLPDGTAFEPGLIYDFWYPATDPKVLGIGFAATRDLVSFLRYATHDSEGNPNPISLSSAATGIRSVLAFGNSQSGRYLRNHTAAGFNQDEAQRKVFDGVLTNVAGIGKVFTNFAFGQSFRTGTQHEDHAFPENWFPFAHTSLTDPVSGQTDALLRGDGFDPLIIEVNTSTEYWQKGASLLHTDPLGKRDLDIAAGVRLFMMAGTQHGGRAGLSPVQGTGHHPSNPHNPTPALRALLVALDEWVNQGVEPPASRVPRLADAALVIPEKLKFPAMPNVQSPQRANRIGVLDDWIEPILKTAPGYQALVCQTDADGNEIAGIRLPSIAAPIATYTGWNLYKAPYPEDELCDREGSYLPFARRQAEREAHGDFRASLEERYGNHADYVKTVAKATEALVAERLLLPEDAERYVNEAKRDNPFNQS
ncbi:MAG: alpha/beta hydrolase domain-containing protein [Candidatus Tectomicrobia bacterium]|nr:alpha/beta hydrolase domain-containing protein [Candidatus Tectomicrobia bacterium]